MRTTKMAELNLVFLELRFFSSMLPSMLKGDIVSMNADDIPMGDYPSIGGALKRLITWPCVAFMTMFIIDVNIPRRLEE